MAIENISHHITRILIIDDDPVSTKLITKLLAQENLLTKACDDPREAWSNFESFKPHVILLDINMPHLSGQELLDIFHSKAPDVPVLMITGDQQEALAKVCLNAGAFDFIEKPIVPLRLICSIRKSLEVSQTEHQLNEIRERLQHNPSRHPSFSKLLTNDSGMEQLFHLAEVAAKSPRDILITGETGTGKDLLAQAIHQISGRTGEFVALNVGGLDDEHFSDTLFGHVKGSFTGAIKDRKGLVEKAAGGTLFLDEIGDLSIASQVKLLRLLQEREFLRIGSDDHVHVDIRFIGATSRLLEEMMQEGTFRRDLYYRLRAQQLRLPPLREREKDITFLWEHFTQIAAQQIGHGPPKFSKEAIEALMSWPFEGNVRELEGLAFQVVGCYKHFVDSKELLPLLSGEKIPQPQNLSESSDLFSFGSSLPQVDELIDHLIIEALRRSDGNQTQAAKMIGMSRRGMISRIQRHHLEA